MVVLMVLAAAMPARGDCDALIVSVASSLTDAVADVAVQFEAEHSGVTVQVNAGGSNLLARQIEAGASVDVFVAAGRGPVDWLIQRGIAAADDVVDVAGNRLVLVGRGDNCASFAHLTDCGRIGIGQPGVPIGDYALQVLDHAGVRDAVADRLVHAANARQLLTYVETRAVDAGIVYATDARLAGLDVLDAAPKESHDAIVYPAVVLSDGACHEVAHAFVAFLGGEHGRAILNGHGFPPAGDTRETSTAVRSARTSIDLWGAMWLSVEVALGAMVFVVPIGVVVGYWLSRTSMPGREFVDALAVLPLVLPPTATGYVLILLLGREGWVGQWLDGWFGVQVALTLPAAGIASAVMALPLMVVSAKAAFARVDRRFEWTSATFGATRWRTFWRVSLPLARDGLLAGAVLSFARAIGEFGATFMLAGMIPGRTMTAPLAILHAFTNHDDASAKVLVLALSGFSFAVILLVVRLQRRAQTDG